MMASLILVIDTLLESYYAMDDSKTPVQKKVMLCRQLKNAAIA
jgi:hypothetical protein